MYNESEGPSTSPPSNTLRDEVGITHGHFPISDPQYCASGKWSYRPGSLFVQLKNDLVAFPIWGCIKVTGPRRVAGDEHSSGRRCDGTYIFAKKANIRYLDLS